MDKFTSAMLGKPFMWQTVNYDTVAVHVVGISPNGLVASLTIDGGEDATPSQRHAELSDGTGFAVIGQLVKRPSTRPLTAHAERVLTEKAKTLHPVSHLDGKTLAELRAYALEETF